MLEKPDLNDEKIKTCLQTAYGIQVAQITFLPIGADPNTAVYRASESNGVSYFVKLRSGDFNAAAVTVPRYLGDLGIQQVIPSLPTQTGELWAELPPFKVILYPFIDGKDGFTVDLSDQHWVAFGAALKRFHTTSTTRTTTNTPTI